MEKKKTAVAARSYTIPAPSEQKTGTWSETATRVLRERYLLRDATGAIVETPDEMCWRVASAVAMAETQWTKDRAAVAKTAQRFYDMMVEHRFLPNSPTLMNAGKGNNLQLSACFPAGAMIATREGPVPIEDIQPGDAVLTDRGRYRPVVETMTRRDLVYRIKVDKLPTFEVTGEHPFFTQRGWVKAAQLEPCADFVFVGTYTERHDADMGLPRISVRGVRVGEHVYHPISVTSSRYGRGEEVSQQIRAVTADVEVDEEIAWLLGYYIAEGSISAGYDLRFTANVNERALLERALDILQRRLNLTGSIYATARTTTHGEWLSARVHSKPFTEWLDIHFSHGFARKKLPAWLFDAPTSVISSFLQGVADGDGTRMNATQIRITLSNEALVRQLFELLRIMGQAPSLSREYLPAHATTQAWSVTYGLHINRGMVHDRADGAVAYRVRSVERVDDTPVDVYNLEVAEDHTYVANQIVVHNCYVVPVEDSLEGIFEAVKHAALIHQSGGGCISGDAHVFTTFCGVEAIETLYARVQETGYAEERRGDHAVIDVRDLNIRTMALNPADGGYEPAQVTHLWRYNVPLDDQVLVRAANGLEVTTSCWHPFMVFNGQQLVERRADSLRAGDILPTSNRTVRERWPHSAYREVAGVLLDEEIAWLLGYYLGDGNLGWAKVPSSEPRRAKLRWRLFDGRTASLEHARDILARRFSVHINIQCDARGLYCLATTDSGFIQRFRDLIEIYPGPKGELPFPEIVAKSPLSVVGAFLAGLVDSDGYVEANRDRVTVTTQSHHLASKVHTLASLLGLAPGLRSRAPQGKGKVTVYEVKLAAEPMIADLRDLIGPYINDTLKSERLAADARNHDHSTETRLSLPFSAVEDVLQSVGVVTTTTEIHRQPVHIGETEIWLHRWKEGLGVNSQKLLTLIAALRPLVANSFQSRLDVLERLARGATTVTAIERPETSVPFYDFTVADHSTYLAGVNGLTAIHNTGFSFSRLRPKGSIVGSTHGVASGPVSFMKIFDGATEAVKQGGTRRGANMGVLRVDHPDIEEFIDCKRDGSVTNFNISVGVTEVFMQALENDAEYELVNPHDGTIAGTRRAREIMDKIVDAAWATGDPGLLFLDRANRSTANPIPEIERLEATNPCGEQWLGPYDACNLGSINVGLFVTRNEHGKATDVDWTALEEATRLCVRFLDDVIDINPYPLEEVRVKVTANRRIGLGIMGWAELLFELGLRYDGDEAIALGERLMTSIRDWSRAASEDIAAEREAFPNWSRSIYQHDKPLRNSTRTTVAPTGSISILAECSSGIEPIFALAFQHRVKQPDGGYRVLDFVNPFFERALMASDIEDKDGVLEYVKEHGSLHGHDAEEHSALLPFVTAHEIAPDWHIRMQAAFQRGVDNSISKCLAAGTLIPTSHGLLPIESFSDVEEPDTFVKIADRDITVGGHRVLQHYYAGEKSATRIRLDNGSELVGSTESHRVFTPDGWRRMSELRPGDLVVGRFQASHGEGGAELPALGELRTNAKLVKTPERMSPQLAQFLGMLSADGHTVLDTGVVGLTSADSEVLVEFTALCRELFGMEPRHTVETRNANVHYLTLNSRALCRWVQTLIGEGAYTKRVPQEILAGSADEKLAFLRGVSLDGYHHPKYGLYIYAGMSERLAYGVAEMGRSFGLPLVRMHRGMVATTGNTSYKVLVSNELQELISCIEAHNNGPAHHATYQVLVHQEVVEETRLPTDHPFYSALRSIKQRQPQNCDNRTAMRLGWSDSIPVYRVTAVEDAGVIPLYDIEVEDAHEYTVNGVVSHNTINLPNSATRDDVLHAYMQAWNSGCLGITIFRDGSKGEQVLNVGVKDEKKAEEATVTGATPATSHRYTGGIKDRPEVVHGYTRQVRAPEGKVNITLNSDEDGLLEIFVNVGKAGSDIAALAEAVGRLASLNLRLDSPLSQNERAREIARQLKSIGGSASVGFGIQRVRSLPDAVARSIDQHFVGELGEQGGVGQEASGNGAGGHANGGNGGNGALGLNPMMMAQYTVSGNLCSHCGNNTMIYEEGCKKCASCGHSEC